MTLKRSNRSRKQRQEWNDRLFFFLPQLMSLEINVRSFFSTSYRWVWLKSVTQKLRVPTQMSIITTTITTAPCTRRWRGRAATPQADGCWWGSTIATTPTTLWSVSLPLGITMTAWQEVLGCLSLWLTMTRWQEVLVCVCHPDYQWFTSTKQFATSEFWNLNLYPGTRSLSHLMTSWCKKE